MTFLTNQELMNNMETIEKFKVGDNVVIRDNPCWAGLENNNNAIGWVVGFQYNCFNEILLKVSIVSQDEENEVRLLNIKNKTFTVTKIN